MTIEAFFENRKLRTCFAGVFTCLIGAILFFLGIFDTFENKTYDNRIIATSKYFEPSEKICFIALDQESIDWGVKEKGWSWPWPRAAYGDIVRFLNAGGAKAVVFDVLYTEPSVYGPQDDESFANACADYGRVVQTMFISSENERVLYPIEPINGASALTGNATSSKDIDDCIRRSTLYLPENSELGIKQKIPSLGTAPLLLDNKKSYNNMEENLSSLYNSLPMEKDGTVYLRYQDSIDNYLPYRASDILASYDSYLKGEECLIDCENFNDMYVYFAFYAPGLFDICSTPVSQVYPGVGVHITLLDNILSGSSIKRLPNGLSILLILLASLSGALVVYITESIKKQNLSVVFSLCTVVGLVALIIFGAYVLFRFGLWIPLVLPLAAFIFSYVITLFTGYITEGRQKRFIKSAFSQYLSPIVIDEIIADPHRLKLGGERREISIFFSDIQGFTSISEKLSPEKLTELLNDFLSEMSDIILNSGGTIDKYEGDAIIAFWNAPVNQKNHAYRAITAALECQRKLDEMRDSFTLRAGTPMYMRIGLNTGNAVVGNMGSRSRFDYTMLGDSVNLAARLEGLNKQFGTYIMCTETTKNEAIEAGCDLYWRELAKVAVVGKKDAVTVFEPMSYKKYEENKKGLEQFEKGRALFYKGDFSSALNIFEQNIDFDKPSMFYAKKCKALLADSLAWEGVWKATEK